MYPVRSQGVGSGSRQTSAPDPLLAPEIFGQEDACSSIGLAVGRYVRYGAHFGLYVGHRATSEMGPRADMREIGDGVDCVPYCLVDTM